METEAGRYGSGGAGLLCAYVFQPGEAGLHVAADEAAALVTAPQRDGSFVWLHFNLANQASRRWMADHLDLPDEFHEALDQPSSMRLELAGHWIIGVVNDVTHFGRDASEISTMALGVHGRLVISARRTPLRSVERLRESVKRGQHLRSPADLLAHLLHGQAGLLAEIVRGALGRVDAIEDRLIADDVAESRPQLGTLRRTLVRLQRLLAPEPSALFRLLHKPPAWISEADQADLHDAAEQLREAVGDCATLIERIRLLQEEVLAVVGEQTNRTLFILTVVTVLSLPMTIVAGFFGMNFSALPFQNRPGGFWLVVTFTLAMSGFGAFLLLRGRRGR